VNCTNGASAAISPKASSINWNPLLERLGRQRQTRHHRRGRLAQEPAEQVLDAVGVALDHGRVRIAGAQQAAERRIEFNQHEARRIDAALHQRLGHRTGAGAKLDDGARAVRIDATRHGARQHLPRRGDGSHRKWLVDPVPDEGHLVQETETAFPLQKTDSPFDLLFKHLQRKQWHGGIRLYSN
jgi:hypothetical protein